MYCNFELYPVFLQCVATPFTSLLHPTLVTHTLKHTHIVADSIKESLRRTYAHTHTHPVSLYNIDLCLLLLWDAVYSGTDNISTLQLAVIFHEADRLISVQLVSIVSTDLRKVLLIPSLSLRHYIQKHQPITSTTCQSKTLTLHSHATSLDLLSV